MLVTTCEFYHDDVTVTSFIVKKFSDAATKFVPNEQHAIVRFLRANKLNANKIQTVCVQYMAISALRNQQYTLV